MIPNLYFPLIKPFSQKIIHKINIYVIINFMISNPNITFLNFSSLFLILSAIDYYKFNLILGL